VFLGSVTTYANHAKVHLLEVDDEVLRQHGAVSEAVALLMAKNCRRIFSADWALSTTGIAGPTGGSKDKPVGLVWIGLAGPSVLLAKQFYFEDVSRLSHRAMTIENAIAMLESALTTEN
jgi:nicotinamide-nucleotide amidase